MNLTSAKQIANEIVGVLKPACTRIEIAGSIRRGKTDVKDIEIVCVPDTTRKPLAVFGAKQTFATSLEDELAKYSNSAGWRLLKNGPRYKQLENLYRGIKLDLFVVLPPAQWGVIFAIRTGPADFSRWMVTSRNQGGALPNDCYVKDGCVWVVPFDGTEDRAEVMPEETDFFEYLELPFMEPAQRFPRWNTFRREQNRVR